MKQITLFLLTCTLFFTACSSKPKELPYTLELTATGIGLINQNTPFDSGIIGTKLLGFEIQQFTFFEEGVPRPIIRVTHNKLEMLLIYPTQDLKYVRSISTTNPKVINKQAHIGMHLQAIDTEKFTCNSPTTKGLISKGAITCQSVQNPTLSYLFQNDTLKEMVWTPQR
jgi:hypothetical protein